MVLDDVWTGFEETMKGISAFVSLHLPWLCFKSVVIMRSFKNLLNGGWKSSTVHN